MRTYKSIDLFAGIGGIRLGFEKAFGQRYIAGVAAGAADRHYRERFDHTLDLAGGPGGY